jgi:PAS domain S-box-containing protein
MKDEHKTKEQLINELAELRQRIAELEAIEAERKRAEEELHRLNEASLAEKGKLENIVKGIGSGLSLLDSETRIVWANEILQGWFGSIEKIGGRPCFELYELDPQRECSALRTLRSGQIEHGEAFAYNTQGDRKYFQLTTVPLKDEDGRIVQIVELTQDITERVRAEEQLKYHTVLLQTVSDAVISTDLNFNILTWNKAAETMYGWQEDEVVGKRVDEVTRVEWLYDDQEDATQQLFEEGFWKGEIVQHLLWRLTETSPSGCGRRRHCGSPRVNSGTLQNSPPTWFLSTRRAE